MSRHLYNAVVLLIILLCSIRATPIDNGLILNGSYIQSSSTSPSRNKSSAQVCRESDLDLLIVLDGSSSIGNENFEFIRKFLVRLIDNLTKHTRVALVQFSGFPREEFSFKTYPNLEKVKEAVAQLPYLTGATRIGRALEFSISNELKGSKGGRADVRDIVITITDGQSQDDPKPAAELIRAMGAITLAVGISAFVDDSQLLAIAGDKSRIFKLKDFNELDENFVATLKSGVQYCELVTETPQQEIAPATTGQLDIRCLSDSIEIFAGTKNPFEGHVYVKGHFNQPSCRVAGDFTNKTAIRIPFTDCGTTRLRSLTPPGIFVETTVIFKFHPVFLTKIDRAFHIRCFYMGPAEKTISSQLLVSALSTEMFSETIPMPVCTYNLHLRTPEGPIVKTAAVGDPIYHLWTCDDSFKKGFYTMRVHSCSVADGSGKQVRLLDSRGCSIDRYLLGNLHYNKSGLSAFVEAHGFKYPEESEIFFLCQISLCIKGVSGCDGPPECMANLTLSDRHKRYLSQPVLPIETTADFRTHLQMFTAELDDHRADKASSSWDVHFCFQPMGFILLSGSTFVSFIMAASLGVAFRLMNTHTK